MVNWLEDGEFHLMNPAILYDDETKEYSYGSSLSGGVVVINLAQEEFSGWEPKVMADVDESACGLANALIDNGWLEMVNNFNE